MNISLREVVYQRYVSDSLPVRLLSIAIDVRANVLCARHLTIMQERALWLTEDEAIGIMEVLMVSPTDLSPAQRSATMKLGEFCREFIRSRPEDDFTVDSPTTAMRADSTRTR